MESEKPSHARQQLLSELKRLREEKGLSGQRLGEVLQWSQSKVSKIENGRTRPSVADIEAWAQACGAGEARTADLVSLAESALTEARTWGPRHGTLAARNREIAQSEQAATHLQNFQPAVFSGLLQTADYARRVIAMLDVAGTRDVAAAVAVRVERQTVLYDPAKRFEFLLTEGALRWRPGPHALMLAQLDRLLSIATLPNVTIGVLPFSREAVALYTNGFTIFDIPDEPYVLVETLTQELRLHEAGDLETYREAFARMRAAAATDADAVEVIQHIRADLAAE
jgi:transcriptional regulator with XRE-family HTH domain